jgi:hypothetical protein
MGALLWSQIPLKSIEEGTKLVRKMIFMVFRLYSDTVDENDIVEEIIKKPEVAVVNKTSKTEAVVVEKTIRGENVALM